MTSPDDFDSLYKASRVRLLTQTYALTGDLPAAETAVRTAYVEAWHHWGRVGRLEQPEDWIRPRAWAHAQRRHSARIWHRDKSPDADVSATLEALGKLASAERRMLLLHALVPAPLTEHAREVGVTATAAAGLLQSALRTYTTAREVDHEGVAPSLAPLAAAAAGVRWPRPTILRRTGSARRRSHLVAGCLAATAAVVLSGVAVTDTSDAEVTLAGHRLRSAPPSETPAATLAPGEEEARATLTDEELLAPSQLRRLAPGSSWRSGATRTATAEDGLGLPCQVTRYADQRSLAGLARTYRARKGAGRVVQALELSATPRRAARGYRTMSGWFAGCAEPGVQLLATREVSGVGDEALLFVLRTSGKKVATRVVGLSRTGQVVTVTAASRDGATAPDVAAHETLLAAAVNRLCGKPGAGVCAAPPTSRATAPLPVGVAPGMLAEVDLPPAAGVTAPWVGTEPRRATAPSATPGCGDTDFTGKRVSNAMTRSFLVTKGELPATFGITQTVGTMARARARSFVEDVRRQMSTCSDRNLGTEVEPMESSSTKDGDLGVWRLVVEIDDERTETVLVAIARNGTAVSHLVFVPSGGHFFDAGGFVSLSSRSLDRLAHMPPPS